MTAELPSPGSGSLKPSSAVAGETDLAASNNPRRAAISTGLFALALVAAAFLLEGGVDLSLTDEGFLWDGVLKTVRGEVPFRDFQSYDPGRYYWCAAGAWVLGPGIVALRLMVALFAVFGVWAGLLAARRIGTSRSWLAAVGVLFLIWMIPRWKAFEHTLVLEAILIATWLIERPTRARHFGAGAFVGLAAFFGRNHGVYLLAAFAGLILLLRIKGVCRDFWKCASAWLAGVAVGGSPLIALLAASPGFLEANLEWCRWIFGLGTTNLRSPYPWPWTVDWSSAPVYDNCERHAVGLWFVTVPVVLVGLVAAAIVSGRTQLQRTPLIAACGFIGLVYFHHALSRADIQHLAQGSALPAMLGLLAVTRPGSLTSAPRTHRFVVTAIFMALSLPAVARVHPLGRLAYLKAAGNVDWVLSRVGNDWLLLDAPLAEQLETVRRFVESHPGQRVLFLPFEPGMYPVLGRTSPTYGSYLLLPATAERQQSEIERLESRNVDLAIVSPRDLDGCPGTALEQTHPQLWAYLMQRFEPVSGVKLPGRLCLVRRGNDQRVSGESELFPR